MGLRSRADARVLAILLLAACTSDPSPTPTPMSPPATPSADASPEPSVPAETGGVYLALGDSITFGIGVPRPQQNGYVALVADALSGRAAMPRVESTRVFAVPGETAAGFLDRRLDDVERAIDELGPRVELVTIGLGANEILRARRDASRVADRASDACRAIVAAATELAASSLDAVVAGVQSALGDAGSGAAVLLLAYYNPDLDPLAVASVAGSDGATGCDPLEGRPGLNDRIACVAAERSLGLVDLYIAFLGREEELTRFGSGDVHPNADGYEVIADTILEALPAGGEGRRRDGRDVPPVGQWQARFGRCPASGEAPGRDGRAAVPAEQVFESDRMAALEAAGWSRAHGSKGRVRGKSELHRAG